MKLLKYANLSSIALLFSLSSISGAFSVDDSSSDEEKDSPELILSIYGNTKEDRADIAQFASLFINDIRSDNTDIIRSIANVDKEDRPDVIQRALSFIKNTKGAYNTAGIIETIKRIQPQDRDDVLQQALPLIDAGYGDLSIIQEIGLLEKNDRVDTIIRAVSSIKALKDDKISLASLISAIGAVATKDPDDILEMALPVINAGYHDPYLIRVIGLVLKKEDRVDVVEKAQNLNRAMVEAGINFVNNNPDMLSSIIQSLGQIPKEDHSDVIEKALPLIKESFKLLDIAFASVVLQHGIDPKDIPLDGLVIQSLKSSAASGVGNILEVLGAINKEDRDDVCERAFPLIKHGSSRIIKEIGEIKKEDRDDVLERSELFIRSIGGSYEDCLVPVVTAVRFVAQDDRADVLEKARLIINANPTLATESLKITKIIEALGGITQEDRHEALQKDWANDDDSGDWFANSDED